MTSNKRLGKIEKWELEESIGEKSRNVFNGVTKR